MNWRTSWLLALIACVVAASPAPVAAGAATIHAKLIYGTNNDDKPKEQALANLEPRFKPDFGFKHYRLLGQKSIELKEDDSVVLDLGHDFEISLNHKGTRKQFHTLQVDLFYKKKWLFWFETSLKQKSEPIFIKGPWTEQGLVIIALEAK